MESPKLPTRPTSGLQNGNRYGTYLFCEPWQRRYGLLLPASVPGPSVRAVQDHKRDSFWGNHF